MTLDAFFGARLRVTATASSSLGKGLWKTSWQSGFGFRCSSVVARPGRRLTTRKTIPPTVLIATFRRAEDVWDAWSFFKLLDLDQGGAVSVDELL